MPETARKFFRQAVFRSGKREPSFLEQVDNHWDQVFAYWDIGLSNGYAEALNHTIRDLDRAARGMAFETLRARILYGVSATSETEKGRSRRPRKARVLRAPLPCSQSKASSRRGR
ncbi:MAG: transposase, partial [Acidobacteriota bacterium]